MVLPPSPETSRSSGRGTKAMGNRARLLETEIANMADEKIPGRTLLIRSRMAPGYQLTEMGRKDLQHFFTDWFPRAVYFDLTADTVSVEATARKDYLSNKSVLGVVFKRADGTVIKNAEYSQDCLIGKVCEFYDRDSSHYQGNVDGFDQRVVNYSLTPIVKFGATMRLNIPPKT